MASTALLDANVLYSASLRDLLLSLAQAELFHARWTEQINDEWVRNLKAYRPDLAEKIDRTRALVNKSLPDCLVADYESLIPTLTSINVKDRHVAAAAIFARVNVIVTFNLVDFPKDLLASRGVDVQHPDMFVSHLIRSDVDRVCEVIARLRGRLKFPPVRPDEYLFNLARIGLTTSAALLRPAVTRI